MKESSITYALRAPPPLACPSSFVTITEATSTFSLKALACASQAWPMVPESRPSLAVTHTLGGLEKKERERKGEGEGRREREKEGCIHLPSSTNIMLSGSCVRQKKRILLPLFQFFSTHNGLRNLQHLLKQRLLLFVSTTAENTHILIINYSTLINTWCQR